MSNSTFSAQRVARKLRVMLHAKSSAARSVNRNYEYEFNPIEGVALGAVINVRAPVRYKIRKGQFANAQSTYQRYAALNLNNQNGVDTNFSSVERAMDRSSFYS